MYLGLFLLILAEALFFQSPAMLVYLAALILFFHAFVIFYEEPKLTRTFGHAYRQYREHVRRWLPSLKTDKSRR
jgi:protein-S-isoprenylcysteine O-methyltransferase Ste14